MKATFCLSVPILVGAAAAVHGSNNTVLCCDAGFIDTVSWEVSQTAPTAATFSEVHTPSSYEIRAPTKVATYQTSWQYPLPTPSSPPPSPKRSLPLTKARITQVSDPATDFQPLHLSLAGPWGTPLRFGAASSCSGLDYINGSATEDGNDPPPKPPSPKSLGKRRWDPIFDEEDEHGDTSTSQGRLLDSKSSSIADSYLAARWLRLLRSIISTAQEDEEPEDGSSWHSGYVTPLTRAAFCLATTQSSDRKRKKQRTSFGESSATGTQRSRSGSAASISREYDSCNPSASSLGGILIEKTSKSLENQESTATWGSSSMIVRPATRRISHEDLVAQVKEIYEGLVMVEGKCIVVELKSEGPQDLSDNGWEALVALHRTLVRVQHHQLVVVREKSLSHRQDRLMDKYIRPIPACYSPLVDHLARYQMIIDAQEQQHRNSWTGVARQWYSQTANSDTDECPGESSDSEYRSRLRRPAFYNDSIQSKMEATHGKLDGKDDSFEIFEEKPNEGCELTCLAGEARADVSFESPGSSRSGSCGEEFGNLLDSLPFEHVEDPLHPGIATLLDKSESITPIHLSPGFDMDVLLDPWDVSPSEKELMNIPSKGEALGYNIDSAPDLGLESDEEWLRSFVDLGMCSHDYSDFMAEAPAPANFLTQPELPIPVMPLIHNETVSYIEPHLTVMTERGQTNSGLQKLWTPSPPRPNTDTEESRSLASPILSSSPVSQLDALPVAPSGADSPPRKGVLQECQYCHKSFSPSELKKHIKYHTKPVACLEPGCKYTCANDHDLQRHHIANHKEPNKQNCPVEKCRKTFTRKDNLLRHLRRVHRGESNSGTDTERQT